MHEETLILIEIGALLLLLSFVGRFAARIGQSPIPFYMTIGLLFGTGGFIGLESSKPFFQTGSEIGVVLLLLRILSPQCSEFPKSTAASCCASIYM
jgi:CPA2 family monovalent cation:H+ antiporter-2